MDLGLRGQVALVTAASRGLGAAVARRFALEGARVALCSRELDHARTAARDITQETGAEVIGLRADVAVPADVEALVRQTVERLHRIDILIVNAGGPPAGTFETLKPEQWEQAAHLTLMSAVRLCQAVVPHMRRQGGGSIVFSTSNSVKEPMANLLLSSSLRMAVIGLMKSLSIELAPSNIRVNAVAPGWTSTERVTEILTARAKANGTTVEEETARTVASIPMGRMGTPEEFANATVFLASPAASYIHGVTLMVDGGSTHASL
jgi:3-oxoacyl-[acyl-carrier protein] reductase